MNLNKVLLMGRLTRDVELRYTASQQAVGNFGLAINRRWMGSDGQQHEEVTFVDCEVWGRQAETMNQYLAKGKPVFIEGRLKLDQWEDKEGGKRSKIKVVVEDFRFIGSREESEGGAPRASGRSESRRVPAAAAAAPDGGHEPIPEDDIPF